MTNIPNIIIGDMDGGKKNIYQTLSFEIWMEERKTYTKHLHLRYGWSPCISQMTMLSICFSLLHPYLK
jgi:hypothetical protein